MVLGEARVRAGRLAALTSSTVLKPLEPLPEPLPERIELTAEPPPDQGPSQPPPLPGHRLFSDKLSGFLLAATEAAKGAAKGAADGIAKGAAERGDKRAAEEADQRAAEGGDQSAAEEADQGAAKEAAEGSGKRAPKGGCKGPAKGSGSPFDHALWPPPPEPLPEGISLVWIAPPTAAERVAAIVRNLPEGESVLLVSWSERVLADLAGRLDGSVAVVGRPSGDPRLDISCLSSNIERASQLAAAKAEVAEGLLEAHRQAESEVYGRLERLARLGSLTRSRELLRGEARRKRLDWESSEAALSDARDTWSRVGSPPKGLAGLIGKKARLDKIEAARLELGRAETFMRGARLEMESLLGEVRTIEAQINEAKDLTASFPPKEELEASLAALKDEGAALSAEAARLKGELAPPRLARKVLSEAPVLMARPWWPGEGALPPDSVFDNLVLVDPPLGDHPGRRALAKQAFRAKKRFLIAGDLSVIGSIRPAPVGDDGVPAWRTYLAADTREPKIRSLGARLSDIVIPGASPARSEEAFFDPGSRLLAVLGPLPDLKGLGDSRLLVPDPSRRLSGLGLGPGLARLDLCGVTAAGPGLRAAGEAGPASPGSAMASIRLALQTLKSLSENGVRDGRVYVLTPTPSQTALALALAEDLGAPPGLFIGRPEDLAGFPPADLVVMDTGLNPPQTRHPWSSPETGRPAFLRALSLASGALVVTASSEAALALPKSSVLSKAFSALDGSARPAPDPPRRLLLDDALDKAKESVLFITPPPEESFWPPLAQKLSAAARRRVKTTVLVTPPEGDDLKYVDLAIRDLRLNSINVILAKGFEGIAAVIDERILALGRLELLPGQRLSPRMVVMEAPRTAKALLTILQYPAIQEKLGPGGLRACPACGWPHVLVNEGRPRDLGDLQPLKIGCLNRACDRRKRPRRLDERPPFQAPPVCPEDGTVYVRAGRGLRTRWICPVHRERCPSYRVLPGDVGGEPAPSEES
jgi:hypothetical protein